MLRSTATYLGQLPDREVFMLATVRSGQPDRDTASLRTGVNAAVEGKTV